MSKWHWKHSEDSLSCFTLKTDNTSCLGNKPAVMGKMLLWDCMINHSIRINLCFPVIDTLYWNEVNTMAAQKQGRRQMSSTTAVVVVSKKNRWVNHHIYIMILSFQRGCKMVSCLSFWLDSSCTWGCLQARTAPLELSPGLLSTTCSPSCNGAPAKSLFSILPSTRKGKEL